jgi:hypothetical protein
MATGDGLATDRARALTILHSASPAAVLPTARRNDSGERQRLPRRVCEP